MKREQKFHVLQISIWKLKQVNKLYGNSVGDKLLIDVADELNQITEEIIFFEFMGISF